MVVVEVVQQTGAVPTFSMNIFSRVNYLFIPSRPQNIFLPVAVSSFTVKK